MKLATLGLAGSMDGNFHSLPSNSPGQGGHSQHRRPTLNERDCLHTWKGLISKMLDSMVTQH